MLYRLLLLITLFPALGATAQPNGIFATFETSLGDFTCVLDYTNAPMTCAHFIGLADGERNWLDPEYGSVQRRPFYDGLTFHRVVAGFVIQSGSRNGVGTDGPGYTFPDEFSTNLLHDAEGVLSMANSGLNSNGSQFFVTLAPTPGLDGLHSVFGWVVSGLPVVQAIGAVAVDGNDKPVTDVVIEGVTIERVGVEAENFDIHAWQLPEVRSAPVELVKGTNSMELALTREEDHEYTLYGSSDLATWYSAKIGLYNDPPAPGNVLLHPDLWSDPMQVYHVADVEYTGPLYVPSSIRDQTIIMDRGTTLIILEVDSVGDMVWFYTDLQYNIIASGLGTTGWSQQAYRGSLDIDFETTLSDRLHRLVFTSPTNGYYRGTVFVSSTNRLVEVGAFEIMDP